MQPLVQRDGDVVDDEVLVVVEALREDDRGPDGHVLEYDGGQSDQALPERPLVPLGLLLVHRVRDERLRGPASLHVPPPNRLQLVLGHQARPQGDPVDESRQFSEARAGDVRVVVERPEGYLHQVAVSVVVPRLRLLHVNHLGGVVGADGKQRLLRHVQRPAGGHREELVTGRRGVLVGVDIQPRSHREI